MSEILFEYKNMQDSFYISHIRRRGPSDMLNNHFHNTYEIYYLISGERYYFIKDRIFHIREKDLILIKAGDLHKTTGSGKNEHERVLINFHKNFIGALPKENNDKENNDNVIFYPFENDVNIIHFSLRHQTQIEQFLNMILDEAKAQKAGYEAYIKTLLLQFLIHIGRYAQNNEAKPFKHLSPIHEKISDIVQYINSNYMEKITLDDISKRFYISRFYFSKVFKEVTGFTFVEYLNSVRVREAQRLLVNTNSKIVCISQDVGFGSIAHFGRVFKAITSYSPLKYRKLGRAVELNNSGIR